MKKTFAVLLAAATTLAADQLPRMEHEPWLGWFAGKYSRDFRFGVDTLGKAEFIPITDKGKEMTHIYTVGFVPVVQEILADGKVRRKKVDEEGWEAVTEKGDKVNKIVYRGKAEGGVQFEVTFDIGSKGIRGGGKILDKGELTEFPVSLAIQADFSDPYRYQKDEKKRDELMEDDEVRMLRVDKKKLKFEVNKGMDLASDDVTGPGVVEMRIEYGAYKGKRFELEAEKNSVFKLSNKKEQPIHKGFSALWSADPTKDPKGQAGFTLSYR